MGETVEALKGYAQLSGKRLMQRVDHMGGGDENLEDFEELITALPAKLGRSGAAPKHEDSSNPQGEGGANADEGCFVSLGNSKSVSRHHATIIWDYHKGMYKIECIGKNGMVVDKIYYQKDEFAFLKDGSAIKVGPACFYFNLPQTNDSDEEGDSNASGEEGDEREEDEEESEEEEEEQEEAMRGGDQEVTKKDWPLPSQSSAQAAQPKDRKPRGKPEEKNATYADMVSAAFRSEELSSRTADGLTSSEITAWIVNRYPEWNVNVEKRRQLQNGVQNVLTRKYEKQPIADGASRGARWKVATGPIKRDGGAAGLAPGKVEGGGKKASPKKSKESAEPEVKKTLASSLLPTFTPPSPAVPSYTPSPKGGEGQEDSGDEVDDDQDGSGMDED